MIPVDPVSATSVWPSAPTRTRENRGGHQVQMVYGKASKNVHLHVDLVKGADGTISSDLTITVEDGSKETISEMLGILNRKRRAEKVVLGDDEQSIKVHLDPTTLIKVGDTGDLMKDYRYSRSAIGLIASAIPDGYKPIWE